MTAVLGETQVFKIITNIIKLFPEKWLPEKQKQKNPPELCNRTKGRE